MKIQSINITEHSKNYEKIDELTSLLANKWDKFVDKYKLKG